MAHLNLVAATAGNMPMTARIPLDLAPALPDKGRYDALVIRLGRLPHGGVLSAGHNNGDQSWTVAETDLKGLYYLPSHAVTK